MKLVLLLLLAGLSVHAQALNPKNLVGYYSIIEKDCNFLEKVSSVHVTLEGDYYSSRLNFHFYGDDKVDREILLDHGSRTVSGFTQRWNTRLDFQSLWGTETVIGQSYAIKKLSIVKGILIYHEEQFKGLSNKPSITRHCEMVLAQ